MDFQHFKDWALLCLVSGFGGMSLRALNKMTRSIETLNIKMAKSFERSEWHTKVIDQHDSRLSQHEVKLEQHDQRITFLEAKRR